MPNFIVHDRVPARITNDFQIDPDPGYMPTGRDTACIAAIQKVLDELSSNANADRGDKLRESLLAARTAWRTAKAGELRAVASDFANASIDAPTATDRCAAIATEADRGNPDVTLAAATAERFTGEFTLTTANFTLDAAAQAYADRQKRLIDDFAADEKADAKARYSEAALDVRRAQRNDALERLKQNFAYWREGTPSETAAANVSYVRGRYSAQRERLEKKLFNVNAVAGVDGDKGYNIELDVWVEDGLPAPSNVPTQSQQDLYVEIYKAETVISTVCRQIRARATQRFWKRPDEDKRGLRLLGEYIDKLVGIGRLGLEGPQTDLAKLALASLREEFIARVGKDTLNRYVRLLGMWAGGLASFFLILYIIVRTQACPDAPAPCTSWWNIHRAFLIAAAGASLGTWASFSVRKINLTFEQLATPEEQLLDAPLRIVFVVVLTMAACLLFWTGAINVKVGDLNTEASWFSKTGSVAMLIGFFCGLSERALASAIAGRASAFIGGIARGK